MRVGEEDAFADAAGWAVDGGAGCVAASMGCVASCVARAATRLLLVPLPHSAPQAAVGEEWDGGRIVGATTDGGLLVRHPPHAAGEPATVRVVHTISGGEGCCCLNGDGGGHPHGSCEKDALVDTRDLVLAQ